jgi:hypothetical protein
MGKQKRGRRSFTPEFKAEAVKVVQQSGKSVAMVARETRSDGDRAAALGGAGGRSMRGGGGTVR